MSANKNFSKLFTASDIKTDTKTQDLLQGLHKAVSYNLSYYNNIIDLFC